MKNFNFILKNYTTAVLLLSISLALPSCNKLLTREDVDKKIQAARDATKDAEKKSKEAIETRQQFYTDYRDAQIQELQGRIKEIDNRILDLNRTAKKSENQGATDNIASAVEELEHEKEGLSQKIDDVNAVEIDDWSYAYAEIEDAISQIEEEINRLNESLSDQ